MEGWREREGETGGGGGNISYLTNNFIMVGCLFVDQSQCITSSLPGVRSYQEWSIRHASLLEKINSILCNEKCIKCAGSSPPLTKLDKMCRNGTLTHNPAAVNMYMQLFEYWVKHHPNYKYVCVATCTCISYIPVNGLVKEVGGVHSGLGIIICSPLWRENEIKRSSTH